MEKKEWVDGCKKVFARLVNDTMWPNFKFPNGWSIDKPLGNCFDKLSEQLVISGDRLVDFCVCQVSAMADYGKNYRFRWKVGHSFGDKAICRYHKYGKKMRAHDDRWLGEHNLSRGVLLSLIRNRRNHPLSQFIFPEYEEHTKRRLHSTEVGYIICGASTLMWTPFSPTCTGCGNAGLCKKRTNHVYPELYRIRLEAWEKQQK